MNKQNNEPVCEQCSKTYIGRTRKYCSIECNLNAREDKRHLKILVGDASHITIKNYLLKTTGCKCSKCNSTTWNDLPIPIELEHKDGNSDNNTLDNCCLLCPNCHAQTPTYKSKNKGNGRHFRRTRYQDGKSF